LIRGRKSWTTLAKNRTIVRWTFAILLVLSIAPTTPADDGPPDDAARAPSEGSHSSPAERLAALEAIAPEDDPALFIELSRRVLADLEANPQRALEAEVRSGLGRALRLDEQFNDAVVELESALDLAGQTNQSELAPTILADLARATFFLGEFDDTLAACREALSLPSVIDDPDQSWVFRNIVAAVHLQQGDFESAIEMSSAALEDRQRVGDRNAVAILLNNIGVAHMHLGDYDPALEYFHQARVIKSELGENEGVADLLSNIADIKNLQGHLAQAIEMHEEALRLRQESGSDLRIAMSHRSLADALHGAGRDREALDQIDAALELLRGIDAEPDVAACLAIKAEALAALGRGSEAVAAATESLELARRMGMRGLEVVALDSMLEARVAAGDLAAALEAQSLARELEGELRIGEVRSEVAEFQARFDAREKETEIELLRKNNQLQALELKQKQLWRNTLLIGLIGFAVFAAVGWHLFLSKRRQSLDRQRADEALLQSMERYRLLFERNLAGVFQTDLDGRITTANQAFTEMLGYENPDELGQRSISELAADPDEIQRFLREITIERKTPNREITLTHRDGSPVFMLMNAGITKAMDTGGRIIETIAIDISERKRAEDDRRRLEVEMQQSQRLESLGVLAGGIAHDFNNMLMAILSNLSLAKRSSGESEETLRRLDEAENVCLRATSLTQQLLTFSKGGRPIRKTATIAELVEEAATFTARGSNSSIDFRSSSELWPADIDEGQIVQVVQNLVANAMESMPYGGIITVTTDNTHLGDGDIPTLEPGRFVRIDVSDTGTGIDESDLDRIFDPFFTTKTGHTGLGLATAFSIARSHGGAIVVRPDPDQGTRFSVYLPAADESRATTETRAEGRAQGHGRLLIMDDDEAVRSAAAELLETIGYSVSTAADGAEAIEAYTEAMDAGRPFSAVVLDLTVPEGIGGRETMTRLLEVDPDVIAIVSSGYSTDPVMANYREHGFAGVAVKPYRLSDLAETLRRATDQREPG
jgi:PAS domain S-box-containing protein